MPRAGPGLDFGRAKVHVGANPLHPMNLKHLSGLALAALLAASSVHSQTTDATTNAVPPTAPAVNKHAVPILAALKLGDAAKEAKVNEVVTTFFTGLNDWHHQNDAALKGLWNDFNHGRSKKDLAAANAALDKIDAVYATFKPQHDGFLKGLGKVLSPEQVETVEDVLTVRKVEVTYNVYTQIFPTLTEDQKTVVLQNLKAAREQAIDASSMLEKSAFFKKYKIKIEDVYLTAQGFDPKKAREDFAAKSAKAKVDDGDAAK